ncbi:hypothetical protein ASPCADRAFT_204753 [Aspergillus carbonarius ITEM 5010]|uniref:Secreted protein n=1 Tax=Aspergillus carbonarius (strain ITEM 5010) TaxID=602072 RepID=A0A1R3RX68_ASPC5|nr:hypothetical protein ASPCADRAFT_204753 [Aspergillus carbonarius ITEM 5010]
MTHSSPPISESVSLLPLFLVLAPVRQMPWQAVVRTGSKSTDSESNLCSRTGLAATRSCQSAARFDLQGVMVLMYARVTRIAFKDLRNRKSA